VRAWGLTQRSVYARKDLGEKDTGGVEDDVLAGTLGRPRSRGIHPRKDEASRWNAGKDLSFVPLRPERVVDVRYDHMEGGPFGHTAQFHRWRPDREPRSCTCAQLEQPPSFKLHDIVAGLSPDIHS
jgi:hypothetical protein